MLLAHDPNGIASLRVPSVGEPLRLLVSGCLVGLRCGVDGIDYGLADALGPLLGLPTVNVTSFCPEQHSMGTPRTTPDIHGGDGFDVLDGRARVLDQTGADLTAKMIVGAEAMLALARQRNIELAILTDMSAACGSQVISDGCRLMPERRYQAGVGVATALLVRNGFPVVSQRDHRTLGRLRTFLDPTFVPDSGALDHHQTTWFCSYFRPAG